MWFSRGCPGVSSDPSEVTLDDFVISEQEDERPDWVPGGAGSKKHCQNCGEFVSKAVRKGFGDNDDIMHRCPSCADSEDLKHGASGDPDYDGRRYLGWSG